MKSSVNQPSTPLPSIFFFTRRCVEFTPVSDVCGVGDVVLVARDQHTVARYDQIGLNEIRPVGDGLCIGSERMLRPKSAGASVSENQGRPRSIQLGPPGRAARGGFGWRKNFQGRRSAHF